MDDTQPSERAGMDTATLAPDEQQLQRMWNGVVGRRTFLQRAGLAGALCGSRRGRSNFRR